MSINFHKINGSDDSAPADFLARALVKALAENKTVLWLIPGGSALAVAVAAAQRLIKTPGSLDFSRLAVTLTDERYGPVGHSDSNWRQLQDAGFRLPGARLLPVLSGADFLETRRVYTKILATELEVATYKLGLFGIGADGHTAGILPQSPAVTSADLVSAYDAGNFSRLTMTPLAIARLDEAIVYATGAEKWPALEKLKLDLDISLEPAQVLKQIKSLKIFSDLAV